MGIGRILVPRQAGFEASDNKRAVQNLLPFLLPKQKVPSKQDRVETRDSLIATLALSAKLFGKDLIG